MIDQVDASYVIVRRDGEDLTRLDPDPMRLVERPMSPRGMMWLLIIAVVVLAVGVPYLIWAGITIASEIEHPTDNPGIAIMMGLMLPAVGLTFLPLGMLIVNAITRGRRKALVEAYARLCGTATAGRRGVVVFSTYETNESSGAYGCAVRVQLENGRTLAATQRRSPKRTSDGVSTKYTVLQVPQYGDVATVFESPAAGLTVVQVNHSWSSHHAGNAA